MDSRDVRRVEIFALLQMAAEALIQGDASVAIGQFITGPVPESRITGRALHGAEDSTMCIM